MRPTIAGDLFEMDSVDEVDATALAVYTHATACLGNKRAHLLDLSSRLLTAASAFSGYSPLVLRGPDAVGARESIVWFNDEGLLARPEFRYAAGLKDDLGALRER